jgi:hypothetical protein
MYGTRFSRRLTTDERPDMYASSCAYVDTEGDHPRIWWSLESTFDWLQHRGMKVSKSYWYNRFKSFAKDPDSYILRSEATRFDSVLPVCTTRALMCAILRESQNTKSADSAKACLRSVRCAAVELAGHATGAQHVMCAIR